MLDDLKAFGAPAEVIAETARRLGGAMRAEVFVVRPENVAAVRLFQALQTQWRWISVSTLAGVALRRTGLDYGPAAWVAGVLGLVVGDGDFHRLRLLESAALEAWAAQR